MQNIMGCFKVIVGMYTAYYGVFRRKARDRERRNDIFINYFLTSALMTR